MATLAVGRRGVAVRRPGEPGLWDAVARALAYLVLITGAVLMFVPFLWSISTSLKTNPEAALFPPTLVPQQPTLEAYRTVIQGAPFPRWFLNSTLVAAAVMIGRLLFDAMAGYAFARLRFPGREVIFSLLIATLMVPAMVLIIPRFILLQDLGLVNTLNALWVPSAASAFGLYLMRSFFESIPVELEEAALIDGASRFRLYWQIILPNALPALATLSIFSFQGSWNNFLDAVIFISGSNRDSFTLPLGLAYFRNFYYTDWPVVRAGSVLTTVKIEIVYVFFQRYFVESLARTGVKG